MLLSGEGQCVDKQSSTHSLQWVYPKSGDQSETFPWSYTCSAHNLKWRGKLCVSNKMILNIDAPRVKLTGVTSFFIKVKTNTSYSMYNYSKAVPQKYPGQTVAPRAHNKMSFVTRETSCLWAAVDSATPFSVLVWCRCSQQYMFLALESVTAEIVLWHSNFFFFSFLFHFCKLIRFTACLSLRRYHIGSVKLVLLVLWAQRVATFF